MSHEFGQVEGDFEKLNERCLKSAIPYGMSFKRFLEKLKCGELALLTDTPSNPVMCRDAMSKSWSLSAGGQETLSPEAKNAFLARTKTSGAAAGSAVNRGAAYTPNIEETYTPEPVKPDILDTTPKLEYEYSFEIACPDDTFRKRVGCSFQIAGTKQESLISRWQKTPTEHGTKYTAQLAFDEPKQLVVKVAATSMGIRIPEYIQVKPIGSGAVLEAFIPIIPSVQLGERLGLPTEGYYYHFHDGKLIQEYKLLGDKKWAFYATRSTHEKLDGEQGYNIYQSAILVFWKLGGKQVENQNLVYLEKQITREELDNLNQDWLAEHGVQLDINELLSALKQPVIERAHAQFEHNTTESVERNLPPVEPDTYNHAANTHYTYQGDFQGTSLKPINSEGILANDLTVVNLVSIPPQDVDDVYLVFADKKMSIEDFAQEIYLSTDETIVEHVLSSNPHLKRSFSQIIEGMPLVVSPWVEKHPDEAFAIRQADDLMDEFLTLSSEEKKWFAKHHETATNALLFSATSGLDIYQGTATSNELSDFNLNHVIAGTGAVVAGAQVQGNKISKRMKSFSEYSRHISEKTKGLSGQALYSNSDYKAWRKEARVFQNEMKSILSQTGKPGYIKNIQAKRINNYLNVDKRQLYRAKDFSKAISGIEMTALYKQAMSFSRFLGIANGLVIGAGLYGNAMDVAKTCNTSGWFEEKCNRSVVKNATSSALNITGGLSIGIALSLAPVTGGLSIALIAGGSFIWGMYGSDLSNMAGEKLEEFIFD
ncbi:LysM peptidoglycan-binding domain-containing protein [Vibrio sp. SCSIO 43169]|uniref:LysM peptidoglycan-binding domain-containing protein n=1 Tax=Vibrio sp. SCSIO 43169 TaxID=2822801 RepID=UPI002043ED78|nr:LysM peptidoglycan-binding domain-containing protein [Vibrio sp. SCSIO 43169]MCM5510793.1 LysM peptidoglycan-binding domain-containing protein [Vibrio sp. SCSIO 43169]